MLGYGKLETAVNSMPARTDLIRQELELFVSMGIIYSGHKVLRQLPSSEILSKKPANSSTAWQVHCPLISSRWLLLQFPKIMMDINPIIWYLQESHLGNHHSPHPLFCPDFFRGSCHEAGLILKEEHSLLFIYLSLQPEMLSEIAPSPYFDYQIYTRRANRHLRDTKKNPFIDYVMRGSIEGIPASHNFDPYAWRSTRTALKYSKAPIIDFILHRLKDPNLCAPLPNQDATFSGFSSVLGFVFWISAKQALHQRPTSITATIGGFKALRFPTSNISSESITGPSGSLLYAFKPNATQMRLISEYWESYPARLCLADDRGRIYGKYDSFEVSDSTVEDVRLYVKCGYTTFDYMSSLEQATYFSATTNQSQPCIEEHELSQFICEYETDICAHILAKPSPLA